MDSNIKLSEMEDELKLKYKGIISNMSHLEIKQFTKGEFKDRALNDLQRSLPGHKNQKQLEESAQCIANALKRETISQLKNRTRDSTSTKTISTLLSITVISDLETTLEVGHVCHSDDDNNSDIEENADHTYLSDGTQSQETQIAESPNKIESSQSIYDSMMILKQVATQNDGSKSSQDQKTSSKCCDTCSVKFKTKSKTKFAEIQCSLCMKWFHDQCVGIAKDQPVGLWLCLTCRKIPQQMQNEVACIKDDVQDLKASTQLILSAVRDLAVKKENTIGEINDKLAALNKQVKSNDKAACESIQSVTDVKSIERKSSQILNKTITILE